MAAFKDQDYKITSSEEYKTYLAALYRASSHWVAEIRVQYAAKAYDMYQNETIRKLVLAYGEEIKKHDEYMLRRFTWASEREDPSPDSVRGDVLNHADSYAETIRFFFDIKIGSDS